MNKNRVFVFAIFIFAMAVYAEAPDMRNVMPNSWRKITRLPAAAEAAFLQTNRAIVDKVQTEFEYEEWFGRQEKSSLEYTRVYRQAAGTDEFYRLVFTHERDTDFMTGQISFAQGLAYKNSSGNVILLAIVTYRAIGTTQHNPVEAGGKAKGILLSEVRTSIAGYPASLYAPLKYSRIVKRQPQGSVSAWYVFMEQLATNGNELKYYDVGIYLPKNVDTISIDGSDCLIDAGSPLRYGLQSAFDGDPATSYVENTDDDLMEIEMTVNLVKRTAIINGYAQNALLYKNNNRARTIQYLKNRIPQESYLKDDILTWQFIDMDGFGFSVLDIYKGDKYNDTCIAEYNIYTEQGEGGWMFGEIDE